MLNTEQTIAQFPDGQITVIPKGLEFLERPKARFYHIIEKDMGSHSENLFWRFCSEYINTLNEKE